MRHFFAGFLILTLPATPLFAGGSAPVEEKPEDPAVTNYNNGTELLFNGQYSQALPLLREAVKLNQSFAEAHNNLAFVLRKQGSNHFKEALRHYNIAIGLDSALAETYMYRGVLYVQMGNLALARDDLATLKTMKSPLAEELEWVINNGKEKTPDQRFGVTAAINP